MKRTTEYNSWNMAGYRARTYVPPKTYVAIAPVGSQQDNPRRSASTPDQTCGGCGHHQCSCARQNSERAERADVYREIAKKAWEDWAPLMRGPRPDAIDRRLQEQAYAETAKKFAQPEALPAGWRSGVGSLPVANTSTQVACPGSRLCHVHRGIVRHSAVCPAYDMVKREEADRALQARLDESNPHAPNKLLQRTWDKCPTFVRPYPDRSHRGPIKAEVRNAERVIVYNPMAAGQADEAYMRCMSLNTQAERAAQAIEANLPT